MKESILDVLLYLFEHYFTEDADLVRDRDSLQSGETILNTAGAGAAPGPESLDPDYNLLWKALGHDPTGMDELVARSGLTVARASAMLLSMELDGRVALLHGRYSRKS